MADYHLAVPVKSIFNWLTFFCPTVNMNNIVKNCQFGQVNIKGGESNMTNKDIVNSLKISGMVLLSIFVVVFTFASLFSSFAPKNPKVLGKGGHTGCTTIQQGTLLTTNGQIITPGFDEWGYNYQARLFSGGYCDAYRDAAWCQPYKDVELTMKWNDAWLSNKDCDSDGLLDRHYGLDSYIGSGAWLTNHQWGSYVGDNGNECIWNYFVKIVAAPDDAVLTDGVWYTADGTEMGEVIWNDFATLQSVYNDPCAETNGVEFVSPAGPGFGKWK
jgi:hypothetical protein